jgi:ATP-dependent 26S proteasome regulatory subunit
MSKGKLLATSYYSGDNTDAYVNLRSLKRELVRAQEEIKRIQSVPLVIGQFMEAIDQKYGFKMGLIQGIVLREFV